MSLLLGHWRSSRSGRSFSPRIQHKSHPMPEARRRKDIPPYLHLWDEADNLDLGEYKTDWEFTREVHSLLVDALGLSPQEFQWTCARDISERKTESDNLAKTLIATLFAGATELSSRQQPLAALARDSSKNVAR